MKTPRHHFVVLLLLLTILLLTILTCVHAIMQPAVTWVGLQHGSYGRGQEAGACCSDMWVTATA